MMCLTEKDIEFIRKNRQTKTIKEIADILKVSKSTIDKARKAYNMDYKVKKWSKEEIKQLKNMKDSHSCQELADIFCVPVQKVRSILQKHNIKRRIKTVEEKFFEKVSGYSNNECWGWHTSKKNNYGRVQNKGKQKQAHRISWELHYGEIPKGLFVCHHCDNKNCVNPKHLFLGTCSDNVQDMLNKNLDNTKGEKHKKNKLKEKEVEEIIVKTKIYNMNQRKLAKEYNVSQSLIMRIATNRNWKHLDRDRIMKKELENFT